MIQVRHRSHATFSRQPRQVRKEATVTGSCVCSEFPVPDLFCWPHLSALAKTLRAGFILLITNFYNFFTTLFARNLASRIN